MSDLVVLCYHALSDDWPATLCVRPSRFERQIELLLERGYEPATFSEAVLQRSPGKRLVVTFDDGFRSVVELGVPILERLGVPATIFAVARFSAAGTPLVWDGIDQWRGGRHERELASLDWTEFRDLARAGWEVGSHTCSHPHLTRLDEADLATELRESRRQCAEGIGQECLAIAYPYGDVSSDVVAAARAAGYETGAALPAYPHPPRHLEWPRIGVYWNDDMRRFKLKVSRAVRRVRTALKR